MRELDQNGKPLTASTFDYLAKGYDGFMGFGYDSATGECCEDCICDDECEKEDITSFELRFFWFEDCADLDISIKFGDKEGGWSCRNNSENNGLYSFDCLNEKNKGHQICWGGDRTSARQDEVFFVGVDWSNFESEKVVVDKREFFHLEVSAHWHAPNYTAGCSGNFDFFMLPCGQPPWHNCNAEGDVNEPFIQKRVTGYQTQANGCSTNKILDLYFNPNEVLEVYPNNLNVAEFDPRGSGDWYMGGV